MSNTISLSGTEDISLGTGFDPIVCSANHSCDPNTVVVFNQPALVVRALRPIAAGEEIFIKYIDITNPRSVRQAELLDQYYFTCKCSKCEQGAAAREDRFLRPLDQLNSTFRKVADVLIQRHAKQLDRFAVGNNTSPAAQRLAAITAEAFSVSGITFDFNKGNSHASEDETRDALRLCLNSGMWDWSRQPVPHLLRQLLVSKLSVGQTYAAWRIAAKMHFLVAPVLHPNPSYPDRLLDTWTLANITNQLISPEDGELYREILRGGLDLRIISAGLIIEVHENLEGSYGRDAPLGRAVEIAYQQITTGMQITMEELKEEILRTWQKFETVARSADVLEL
jgi:SET and MYND domain-containing protein